MVMALSGVFFPVEALPAGLLQLAMLLPTTHAFAAVRRVLDGGRVPWDRLGLAVIGTAVALVMATWLGARMLSVFRSRGFVTRYS